MSQNGSTLKRSAASTSPQAYEPLACSGLIFPFGYNFHLLTMVAHHFFHDCHLGNIKTSLCYLSGNKRRKMKRSILGALYGTTLVATAIPQPSFFCQQETKRKDLKEACLRRVEVTDGYAKWCKKCMHQHSDFVFAHQCEVEPLGGGPPPRLGLKPLAAERSA